MRRSLKKHGRLGRYVIQVLMFLLKSLFVARNWLNGIRRNLGTSAELSNNAEKDLKLSKLDIMM